MCLLAILAPEKSGTRRSAWRLGEHAKSYPHIMDTPPYQYQATGLMHYESIACGGLSLPIIYPKHCLASRIALQRTRATVCGATTNSWPVPRTALPKTLAIAAVQTFRFRRDEAESFRSRHQRPRQVPMSIVVTPSASSVGSDRSIQVRGRGGRCHRRASRLSPMPQIRLAFRSFESVSTTAPSIRWGC